MTVSTYYTTLNGDGSLTSVFCMSIDSRIRSFAGISISTYRAVCAATIYIMENVTAIDCDFCVTLDETISDIGLTTEATAIDITISSTAIDSFTNLWRSDGTAVHNNICTTIY